MEEPHHNGRRLSLLLEVEVLETFVVVNNQLVSLQLQIALLDKPVNHPGNRFTRRARHIRQILLQRKLINLDASLGLALSPILKKDLKQYHLV